MKQDFYNGLFLFLFLLLVIAIIIVIIGCKMVVDGQKNVETYQKYLYSQER